MPRLLLSLSLAVMLSSTMSLAAISHAQTWVNGYTRSNGTTVQGHYRSNADGNRFNNYSTQGNTNPFTGQQGTVNPYNNGNYNSQPSWGNQQPSWDGGRRGGFY